MTYTYKTIFKFTDWMICVQVTISPIRSRGGGGFESPPPSKNLYICKKNVDFVENILGKKLIFFLRF